jgi:molybdopterin-guanine dinucleotide biosynthesis protein A
MIAIGRITGLVLAGGRGTRMGSVDKGLQPLDGEPLVAHVLRRFVPQVGTIAISANRNVVQYAAYGHAVVADVVEDFAGPLAGLHAGLVACGTEFLCAVPCDAPFLPHDLVANLSGAMQDDVDAVVAEAGARRHPVFCLMRRTVVDDLAAWLASGGRAVHRWIERLPHRAVSFDDEQAFVNLNTLDELRALEGHSPDRS